MDRQGLYVALLIALAAPVAWRLGLPMWFVWTLVTLAAAGVGVAWWAAREGNDGHEN